MHTIRLRGPWQVEPVARFVLQADGTYRPVHDDLPPAARVTMPADWSATLGGDFLGRVRYRAHVSEADGVGRRASGCFWWWKPARSAACVQLTASRWAAWSGRAAGRFEITELLRGS